jgi:hypothetical protein
VITPWIQDLINRWEREAAGLERQASDKAQDYSELERRLLRMNARVKRGDANDLRAEAQRVRRG